MLILGPFDHLDGIFNTAVEAAKARDKYVAKLDNHYSLNFPVNHDE